MSETVVCFGSPRTGAVRQGTNSQREANGWCPYWTHRPKGPLALSIHTMLWNWKCLIRIKDWFFHKKFPRGMSLKKLYEKYWLKSQKLLWIKKNKTRIYTKKMTHLHYQQWGQLSRTLKVYSECIYFWHATTIATFFSLMIGGLYVPITLVTMLKDTYFIYFLKSVTGIE